jgi:type IV pilus assembly protein PilV
MHQLNHTRQIGKQRGITLLESLIAIVVAALGILGILGVQMRTLTDTQTSMRRAQAIRLIEDLSERMKVNPNALSGINTYVTGWTATPPTTAATKKCVGSTTCTQAELAEYDLKEWKRLVERSLPLGNAATFLALADGDASSITNRRQLGVLIRWRENERETLRKRRCQKGLQGRHQHRSQHQGDGSIGTKDPTSCPANFTCHLQYIPVSARCAPDFRAGNSAPLFFCPGT